MRGRVDDIIVAGVGGQGVLLATDVLAEVFLAAGFEVKKSEVHGMAQRGGSVESHVRRGDTVHSPLIPRGQADILLGLEMLEALRCAVYLRPGGIALVSDQRVLPPSVVLGKHKYPEDIAGMLARVAGEARVVPAQRLAAEAGHGRAVNSVMLGVLSTYLDDIGPDLWAQAMAKHVPARYLKANVRAFRLGRQERGSGRGGGTG